MKRWIAVVSTLLMLFCLFPTRAKAATQAPVDITDLSIVELQQAVDNGLLTYETIMVLFLERLEAYGTEYECVITVNDTALDQARACDVQYQQSGRTSLLFGLPIVVKDNIDVVGMPTTGGTQLLADSYPAENAPVVQALLDAGAIVVAKSNMDLLAMQASRSESDYGTVQNAYQIGYSSYGSSGGSAVCLALSLCVGALGTDTNSSLRLPAVANGVVALRPTKGSLSQEGILPYDYERDTAGPMARSMEDLTVLYDLLAGTDCVQDLDVEVLDGLTVGVVIQLCGIDGDLYCDEEVSACFLELLELLEEQGAEVVYLDEVYTAEYADIPSATMSGWTFAAYFDQYIQGTSASIRSFAQLAQGLRVLADYNNGYTVQEVESSTYLAWQTQEKEEYREHLLACMDEAQVDVLIFPSMRNRVMELEDASALYNNTSLFAPVTGFPELSLPMGMDSDGLPMGVELLAGAGEDMLLLQIGYGIEQALEGAVTSPEDADSLYEIPEAVQELVSWYGSEEIESSLLTGEEGLLTAYESIGDWLEAYPSYEGNLTVRAQELLESLRQAWLNVLIARLQPVEVDQQSTAHWWIGGIVLAGAGTGGIVWWMRRRRKC